MLTAIIIRITPYFNGKLMTGKRITKKRFRHLRKEKPLRLIELREQINQHEK